MALPTSAQNTELISINAAGTATGNGESGLSFIFTPRVSANGRFVVFVSEASDLSGLPDNNMKWDIYLRDRETGTTTLISVNFIGTAASNGDSNEPVITPDGRFVAFSSNATDLVTPAVAMGPTQLYVRDTCIGAQGCAPTTTLVSHTSSSLTTGANNSSGSPSISNDGRFVAFISTANNLVTLPTGSGQAHVYVNDRTNGANTLVSVNSAGTAGGNNGVGEIPVISPDGSRVAFISQSSDLVSIDNNNQIDAFVRDLPGNTTLLLSLNSSGTNGGNGGSIGPLSFSADGNRVVFRSNAPDLVAGLTDTNNKTDVFLRDLMAASTTLVSINNAGSAAANDTSGNPMISGNGNFVAFESTATDILPLGLPADSRVYVRNLLTASTILASVTSNGSPGAGSFPAISADGNRVAFRGDSLTVTPDNNDAVDIYVRDLTTGPTVLASINSAGTAAGNSGADQTPPTISSDGTTVTMVSNSTDLVMTTDANPGRDVFVFDPSPMLNPGGAVNAASFMQGAGVAPGSIGAVFGTQLSSFLAFAGAVPLPTTLGGATMLFNGVQNVPKFFASRFQVNIQYPWELTGQMAASLTNSVFGATSNAEMVNLATFAPGLFATNQQGTGQGAILIANTPNLAAPMGTFPGSRPAVPGDFLEIYWTGGGPVTNQPATGAAAVANPLSATTMTPTLTIGGVATPVLFSGLAPGFVGLYVVTCQVQAGTPTGMAVPVVLTIGGVQSNPVTIAVE